jgi:DNA helicase-2/ATP-dependent DNA helicase PcrA
MEAVRRAWEAWAAHPPAVKELEYPFDWRLGEHSLKGAIDRIDECPDGSVVIIDYKTGRAKESGALESDDKEQLRIYQLAMEERGMRVSSLRLSYVLHGVLAEVDMLEGGEKAAFKASLQDRMSAILASEFPPKPEPFVCRYCDFRNICEFRKL